MTKIKKKILFVLAFLVFLSLNIANLLVLVNISKKQNKPSVVNTKCDPVLEIVNYERMKAGCDNLHYSRELANAARKRAEEVAGKKFFSHDGFNKYSGKRFGDWVVTGENLAKNYFSSQKLVHAWINSESHNSIIKDCDYEVGAVGKFGNITVLLLGEK